MEIFDLCDVEAIFPEYEPVSLYLSICTVHCTTRMNSRAHLYTHIFLLHFQTPFDSMDRVYFRTNGHTLMVKWSFTNC